MKKRMLKPISLRLKGALMYKFKISEEMLICYTKLHFKPYQ